MARAADPRPERARRGLSLRRQLWSAAAAVVTLAALTIALRAIRDDVSLTMVFLAYFAAVVGLSAAGGPVVGLAVALAAFGVVNFFFTEPVHTFNVAEAEQLIELLIFLAVSGTVATLVDTASRRLGEIEAHSQQAAQLEATNDLRTALLRAVSHDLRTPLATAKMATSSLLATDVELPAETRTELLELADAELDRLVRLVENLLDAGRLQAGVLDVTVRPVSVDDLFARTLAALPDGDRPRVMAWLAEGATTIVTDPALLERVLANLISNALAADPTGHIAVNAEPGETPGTAVLDVVDHGPGMSDEQRANAFSPFQRYDDRGWSSGIGLGLPICKGFCEAIGATLELIGSEGGGLTARISVPVAAPGSAA